MIIWRGWGILALLIPILLIFFLEVLAGLLAGLFGANAYQQISSYVWPLGWLIAAGIVWRLGRSLNQRQGRLLIDPTTHEQFVLRSDHSLFFIKMEYWAYVMLVGALLGFVGNLLS
jgi:hypothetical protein